MEEISFMHAWKCYADNLSFVIPFFWLKLSLQGPEKIAEKADDPPKNRSPWNLTRLTVMNSGACM